MSKTYLEMNNESVCLVDEGKVIECCVGSSDVLKKFVDDTVERYSKEGKSIELKGQQRLMTLMRIEREAAENSRKKFIKNLYKRNN